MAFIVFKRAQELSQTRVPKLHFGLFFTARQHSRNGIALGIPSIFTRNGVVGVPTDGYDAPLLMVGNNLLAHLIKGNAIQIFVVSQF